ncbi:helix-turn-helix transcriptional regulator [Pseudophaeobacter leonis]|uniref:helix-turn-helix transcriptional regulator n=1 Tax=Pseudophaeobacter leonis TaxID=1144477 RepID=UPI00111C0E0A|nr:helix-turn-helix domain-containing protein [Pseudophaeobacter leonis]
MNTDQPIYVPLADSKKVFSVSRDTIYRAAKKGLITIHKAQGRSLLKVSEVCAWIEGGAKST